MKRIIFILQICVCLVIISCNRATSHKETIDETFVMIDDNNQQDCKLSRMFAEYELIRLDEGSIPLGELNKFRVIDNYIYALSRSKLFKFSNTGEMISVLDKSGRGPGEYINAYDFTIDDENLTYIVDFQGKKIEVYNEAGDHLKSWQTGLYSTSIRYVKGEGFYLFTGFYNTYTDFGDYMVYLFSRSGDQRPSGKYIEVNHKLEQYLNFVDINNFNMVDSELLLGISGFDTIYSINPEGMNAKYIFDFKNGKMDESVFENEFFDILEFMDYAKRNNLSHYTTYFLDSPKYLFSKFLNSGEQYLNIYFKDTKESTSTSFIIDDVFLEGNKLSISDFYPMAFDGTYYYFIYQAFNIVKYLDEHKEKPTLVNTDDLYFINNIKIEDNPLILKLKAKD